MSNLFMLRLETRLPRALKENIVGIGFANAIGLTGNLSWSDFKNIIDKSYPGMFKPKSLGLSAGSARRFLQDINENDLIVVPDTGKFHIAKVLNSKIIFETPCKDDLAYQRNVEWVKKDIPRCYASNQLQRRLKAQQTCVYATDLSRDLEEAKNRVSPIDFSEEILNGSKAAVAKALHSAINDRGLEEVVRRLLCSSGASSALILPRNKKNKKGDADIEAIYDLGIGSTGHSFRAIYQIKQHEGETPVAGIQQLIDFAEEYDKACLVTTAKKLTKAAEDLAKEFNILVITEDDLIEWILSRGLDALDPS